MNELIKYIKDNNLDSSSRHKWQTWNRTYLVGYLKNVHNLKPHEIGKVLNRDRTTIIHALNNFDNWFNKDKEFMQEVEKTSQIFPIKKREWFIIDADITSGDMLDVLLPFFNQYNTIVRYTKDADFIKVTKVTKSEFKKF